MFSRALYSESIILSPALFSVASVSYTHLDVYKRQEVQLEELEDETAIIPSVDITPQKVDLGMDISEITADLQQKYGFTESKGVVVVLITPGGPAEAVSYTHLDVYKRQH